MPSILRIINFRSPNKYPSIELFPEYQFHACGRLLTAADEIDSLQFTVKIPLSRFSERYLRCLRFQERSNPFKKLATPHLLFPIPTSQIAISSLYSLELSPNSTSDRLKIQRETKIYLGSFFPRAFYALVMTVWQADFYKKILEETGTEKWWQLLICDRQGEIVLSAECPQSEANSDWLGLQLQQIDRNLFPDKIQVFRPQAVGLFGIVGKRLGIKIEETRRTKALKEILKSRFYLTDLERTPPQPLPENLWGETWRFASIIASEIEDFWRDRPIPILDIPEELTPMELGIASTISIPGIIIYGGRKSMYLSRWLQDRKLFAINYIPTEVGRSGGLILETGLVDRWVIATFEDGEMAKAAQAYERGKQTSQGLHFLLIQPDDSGITYSGFWLLQ